METQGSSCTVSEGTSRHDTQMDGCMPLSLDSTKGRHGAPEHHPCSPRSTENASSLESSHNAKKDSGSINEDATRYREAIYESVGGLPDSTSGREHEQHPVKRPAGTPEAVQAAEMSAETVCQPRAGEPLACTLPSGAYRSSSTQSKRRKCSKTEEELACDDPTDERSKTAVEAKPHDMNAPAAADMRYGDLARAVGGWASKEDKPPNVVGKVPPKDPSTMYQSAWILAPMVRISTLPFRLECLKYGADLVFTEEIIDWKLLDTKRYENKDFSTIEYICKNDRRCIFSTCELEAGKVVLQLGTADPTRALQAATTALQDIAAVDINMGCPKSFSVKGGMGAALLQTPDLAMDILKTLTRNLPCPVTCKIRLLDSIEETVDFARKCESAGIAAITVHARTLRSALKIPLIANGDFLSPEDAVLFQDTYDIHSLMFARGAMWNPALFSRNPRLRHERTPECAVTRSVMRSPVPIDEVYSSRNDCTGKRSGPQTTAGSRKFDCKDL
ncbi:dihydrouridine synthase domain-containing protein [Cyclospora cayetanensis]|uniref:Dihydrouridine synthase domain-containing protein n=1 Tax=Cyclospora cayetanensis TaxID=88456 RepID=A0A1D3D6V7_9EIME|nr:dihydrouridine synthase domain-containing protein [Cyclospora cayetanensis]